MTPPSPRDLRVVAIGGGTGIPVVLRGLKRRTSHITAIVTVTDDGGSSGRLRDELGILPPGDIRNCLIALAEAEPLMEQLFQHRFSRGGLAGHSVGNLLIGALAELLGDFEAAVEAAGQVLRVHGTILPSTLAEVRLRALMADGSEVSGESAITASGRHIERIFLEPPDCRPVAAAVEAVRGADLIVIGPGSLYTSVIPNLLVKEMTGALREARAARVYVSNVMTQPGETVGYNAADHLEAIEAHVGKGIIDCILVNTGSVEGVRLERYRHEGRERVDPALDQLAAMGVRPIAGDIVSGDELVRHDPARLAEVLLEITALSSVS